ncbi:nuclear transport factor 2 family protein [uncultured Paraglaciecola sp.]|uniref:nuclear transport factor 2 family protein n=1 Tax=uncultured Paraglaciecola sp. TaxID=1765024 RepID=UPI0030DAA016|tara:strand:- start:1066 stop:1527 length:462 start_codon:yes stop_codon:yes gene_type:complete
MKIPTARFSACVRYAFSILVALSVFSFQSHAQQATANLDRIASFMQAYNAHDINAMLLNMTEDVKWLNVANNQLVAETADKNQLNEAMQAHFKAKPDARSRIKDSIVLGNTIAIVEEAFSLKNGITSSQCAMSIYQLRKGLISSITYYATAKC